MSKESTTTLKVYPDMDVPWEFVSSQFLQYPPTGLSGITHQTSSLEHICGRPR